MKIFGLKRIEIVAAAVSAAILLIAAMFWISQVLDVRATLEKAYGG
jgi:Co/Zn/Cd efflux system component